MPTFDRAQADTDARAMNSYSVAKDQFRVAMEIISNKFHTGLKVNMQYSAETSPDKSDTAIRFLKDMQSDGEGGFTLALDIQSIVDELDQRVGLIGVAFTEDDKNAAMGEHIKNVQNQLASMYYDYGANGDLDGLDDLFQMIIIDQDPNEGHDLALLKQDCIVNMPTESKGFNADWCQLLDPTTGAHAYFFGSTAAQTVVPVVTITNAGPPALLSDESANNDNPIITDDFNAA